MKPNWPPSKMTNSRYLSNEFVIRGRKTPLWAKLLGSHMNSETSFRSRTPDTAYDVGKYASDGKAPSVDTSNLDVISMKKSVTFNKCAINGFPEGGDQMNGGDDSDQKHMSTASDSASWCIRPVHLDIAFPARFDTLPESSLSSISSEHAPPAAKPASDSASTSDVQSSEFARTPAADMEQQTMSREYFPLTLATDRPPSTPQLQQQVQPSTSAAASSNLSSPHLKESLYMPTGWRPEHRRPPWKPQRSKSPRYKRPSSGQSSSSSNSKSSVDRMFLHTTELLPPGSVAVLMPSPYQHELAKLRMERLRIEEDHLLEVKRQDELERIRGPLPKWYELKTHQFHYESQKNREVLRNKPMWQSLMGYRVELERASRQFQRSSDDKRHST